jgi:uncharacterized protein YebE (UPF0316 family)
MESTVSEFLGINSEVCHWVIVPLFIFLARICDVSIATIRVMFVLSGRKNLAPFIGFFEALIWLVAIGQILQNVSNPATYIAYAAGFGMGTYVGMIIEEKLALGQVILRIITQRDASRLLVALQEAGFRITSVDAEGSRGKVNLIFTVCKRKKIPDLKKLIRQYNPNAFYTIENVKFVSDTEELAASQDKSFSAYGSIKTKRR